MWSFMSGKGIKRCGYTQGLSLQAEAYWAFTGIYLFLRKKPYKINLPNTLSFLINQQFCWEEEQKV